MKKTICSGLFVLFLCAASICLTPGPASASPSENAVSESSASFDMGKVARFGFGNILLGGWTPQDGWVKADQLQSCERFYSLRIWGGEACRVVGLNGTKEKEAVISAIHSDHSSEFKGAMLGVPSFDIHTSSGVIKAPSGLLAILCEWEVQPRKVTVMNTGSATYQAIMQKFLATKGLPVEKPSLVQLFKIDLEGDGVDEVLICAQNIASRGEAGFETDKPLVTGGALPGAAHPGAYSVLMLRKIVNGKVLELPLHVFVSPRGSAPGDEDWTPPVIGKVCQFADLNGDGVLEIIVATAFCEGYAYHAFEVKGGKVREVLANGVGG